MKHPTDGHASRSGAARAARTAGRKPAPPGDARDAGRDRTGYEDMPSVTNRQWGPGETAGDTSFGTRAQGGHGDFRDPGAADDRRQPRADAPAGSPSGQGGFGEDQGRHAQSGQSRGGSRAAGISARPVSRGVPEPGAARQHVAGNDPGADTRIADDLVRRLGTEPQLAGAQILVNVEDGVVTLTGEVEAARMKQRAGEIAGQARDVREVHNTIAIDPGARAAGPPGAAVRSGHDQRGSGFSSSARIADPAAEPSTRAGRAGPEPGAGESTAGAGPRKNRG